LDEEEFSDKPEAYAGSLLGVCQAKQAMQGSPENGLAPGDRRPLVSARSWADTAHSHGVPGGIRRA